MATLQVAPELMLKLTIKHTFVHYNVFHDSDNRRASSCPPDVVKLPQTFPFVKLEEVEDVKHEDVVETVEEIPGFKYGPDSVRSEATAELDQRRLSESSKGGDTLSIENIRVSQTWKQPRQNMPKSQSSSQQVGKGKGKGRFDELKRGGGVEEKKLWEGKSSEINSQLPARSSVILRGLPYQVTEDEIAEFLSEQGIGAFLAIEKPVTIVLTAQGRPSGLAEVRLMPFADMPLVRQMVDRKYLGGRYVEVFLPNTPAWRAAVQKQTMETQIDVLSEGRRVANKRVRRTHARRTYGGIDRDFQA
eukprot:TRINITY_DN13379_c0_g1_i1.p1 TRINITY_DN13379_c0_g1~~TRINITY_DN13379_c0_g1_i1.p1  ORF type:complete len:303 (-),score=42.54 TRINITY_DN13379_c0_g1_i1:117-1025(-)